MGKGKGSPELFVAALVPVEFYLKLTAFLPEVAKKPLRLGAQNYL